MDKNEREYKGPERRITSVHCACHVKHVKQLTDHEKDIEIMQADSKKDHREIWTDIKAKVPNHLFYLFISVFSVLYIVGIIAVYTGMHKIDKSLSTQIGGINTEVKVMSTTLNYLDKKVDDHIYHTKNGGSKH